MHLTTLEWIGSVSLLAALASSAEMGVSGASGASDAFDDDARIVAALDAEYQEAVRRNDEVTMDRILADDFVLVTGRGAVYDKADLLAEARDEVALYERQEDSARTVRVWGDTAVVTALLWAKGTKNGQPFDYRLWFSDVYLRRPEGWRYVFAQSSLPLTEPEEIRR